MIACNWTRCHPSYCTLTVRADSHAKMLDLTCHLIPSQGRHLSWSKSKCLNLIRNHGSRQVRQVHRHTSKTRNESNKPRIWTWTCKMNGLGIRESLHLFLVSGNFLGISHLYRTSGISPFIGGKPYHSDQPPMDLPESRAQDSRRWSMGMMRRWGEKGDFFEGMKMEVPRFYSQNEGQSQNGGWFKKVFSEKNMVALFFGCFFCFKRKKQASLQETSMILFTTM